MDSKETHHAEGHDHLLDDLNEEESYKEESLDLPDGRVAILFEGREYIRVDSKHEKDSTFPLPEILQYVSIDQWIEKNLSWKKEEITHLDFVSPEKTSNERAIIYKSLSHSIEPDSLIRLIHHNAKITELGVLFHNAWSREAIHCGPHWPVWEQEANYFFSPTAISELMKPTSFTLKASYPVEYLMHENTMKAKKVSHPKTAFWRGRIRSLIHRIGGRLNTDDAGHIFYHFTRNT